MNKIGQLTDRKRVMVFADTENAVDCKSHFPYIAAKVDFGADNFIKAVRDALEEQSKHPNGEVPTTKAKKLTKNAKEETLEEHVSVTDDDADELRDMGAVLLDDEDELDNTEVDTAPWDEDEELDLFDEDDSIEDETFDEEAVKNAIRAKNKTADAATKKKVLELRGETLLKDIHDEKLLKEILKALA